MACALRFQDRLPIKFWRECALTACYLITCTPSPLLENKTPYEMLFGKIPSYEPARVFGCLYYAHNQRSKGDKFESRGRKCVFLAYHFGKKGWNLFDLETREFFVSRDVRFYECIFPFGEALSENLEPFFLSSELDHVENDDSAWWHMGILGGVHEETEPAGFPASAGC